MNTTNIVAEGAETMDRIVENAVIERASAEPESLPASVVVPTEDSELLGYSKRVYPKRLLLLYSVIVIFFISAASTIAAGVDVMYIFICYFAKIDQDKCLTSDVAGEKVANFTAVSSIVEGVLSLAVTTYMSALSDHIGRRPLIITAMVLTGVAHIMAWYIVFHLRNPSTYWWLLVPRIISALGGGARLVEIMCVSYISDIVRDPAQRAKLISILDGCSFASLAVAPTLGSVVIRYLGIEFLYIASFVGCLFAGLLAAWLLQESLSAYHRRRNSTSTKIMQGSTDLLLFKDLESSEDRRNARLLLVISICVTTAIADLAIVQMLYPKRVFGWSAVASGYMISVLSGSWTIWVALVFPAIFSQLSRMWPVHSSMVDLVDLSLLRISMIVAIIGYLTIGYAQKQWQFVIGSLISTGEALAIPICKSVLLKYVPHGRFGTFMAGLNFLNSIFNIALPTLMLKLYSWSFTWRRSLPFETVSAVLLVLIVLTLVLKPHRHPVFTHT